MQRTDKNIDELLEHLRGTFHRVRQSGIDEELFDLICGFEALSVAMGQDLGASHGPLPEVCAVSYGASG